MRRLAIAGALLASAAGAALVANAADQAVNLTATVDGFCEFNSVNLVTTGNMTQQGALTTTSGSFTVDDPTDAAGQIQTALFILQLPTTCNKAATATLTSANQGLKDTTAPITGIDPGSTAAFRSAIHYTASMTGPAGIFANLSTFTAATASDTSTGAFTGNVTVNFQITNAGQTQIVTAGDYADILTVSIVPN